MFPQRLFGHVTEDFDFSVVHRAASILDCLDGFRLVGQVGVPNVLFVLSALILSQRSCQAGIPLAGS